MTNPALLKISSVFNDALAAAKNPLQAVKTHFNNPHDTRKLPLKAFDFAVDAFTHPANIFAVANYTGITGYHGVSTLDHVIVGGIFASTIGATAHDSFKNKPISTPFFVLSGLTFAQSARMLAPVFKGPMTEWLANAQHEKAAVAMGTSLAAWALGHGMLWYKIKSNSDSIAFNAPYAVGDVTAAHIAGGLNIPAIAFGGASLARTFWENSFPEKIRSLITPPRLLAAGYFAGAVGAGISALDAQNPVEKTLAMHMSAMQFQCVWAYLNFDIPFNRLFKNGVRKAMNQPPIETPPEVNPA